MADDASVKMETLKKAYAEIILNTSKEAAARIMVADRRAFCFQRDLIALKEDALRLLIQLKQMLDSKTVEAEVTSKNQQRKIEELEDQLSEAEGIIVDLREELRLTQDKLEEVRCNQWWPLKQQTPEDFEDQPPPLDDELIAKTDDKRHQTIKYPSTENACGKNISAEMTLQYAGEDQHLMSAGERPSTPLQPSMLSCAVKYPSTEDACSTKNPTEVTLQYSSGDQLPRSDGEKLSTSCLPSILSLSNSSVYTFGDVKANKEHCSSCSSEPEPDDQDVKLVSNGSQAKSQEFESHHGQSLREGFRRNRKNLKYQEAIAALRRSSHGRHAKSFQLTSLSKCKSKAVKQNKASIEEAGGNGTCPTPGSSYKMNHNHDTAQERSTEFAEKSRSEEMQVDAAEKESDMSCDPLKFDTSLADCNLHDVQISDDEESTGISNRADSDKVLKFTFQRKRKKELLAKLGSNITPEGNNAMSRALLEKGDAAKLQKSTVKEEQSKDGGQLLQIAYQLISLSGNGHS